MELLIVFLWILFGLVCMIIASSRNRSGCGWFILGCLLGPLAILVIAILPPIKPPTPGQKQADAEAAKEKVKCPFCAELIQPEAVLCRFCGKDIPPPAPPKPKDDPDVERIKNLVANNAAGGTDSN